MPLLPLVWVGCTPGLEDSAPSAVAAAHAMVRRREPGGPLRPQVRASFEAGEVVVSAPWPDAPEVGLSLVGWGEGGAPAVVGGRTTYLREGVLEWWERGPEGLEQGFVVDEPPVDGPLVLELALRGATALVDSDGRSATFLPDRQGAVRDGGPAAPASGGESRKGRLVARDERPDRTVRPGGRLRYEGLAAWDATGADLPAWMEATDRGLRLVVDTERAVAPVTVDPTLAVASWSVEGDQDYAYLGGSVASAGDVNGDGFGDVIVGVEGHDGAYYSAGAARLYLGSAAGLSGVASWTAYGGTIAAKLGASVASAGDVNGDGFGDVVIGAEADDAGEVDEGTARLYLGSAAGLSAAPAWIAEGDQAGARFGRSVASAGDVNGDGYDDLVVGAYTGDNGQTDEGIARLYLGSAAGLSAAPAWTAEGDQAGALFGGTVASAGDVNRDGYDDVVVGANEHDAGQTGEGVVYLYLGSAAGLAAAPAWTAEGDQAGADLGYTVASAGDVNGDGFGDLVVGAPNLGLAGAARLYLGSAAGLAATPAWTAAGDQAGTSFGLSVASAGDVNGDGFGDVTVGANEDFPYREPDGEGTARVYLGSAAGLSATAAWIAPGSGSSDYFGSSVASAGDVDGDGYGDLVVGAYQYDHGEANEGATYVYTDVATDRDGDGVYDTLDLCPSVADPAQLDTDGDRVGDACEVPLLEVVGEVSSGSLVSLVVTRLNAGEVVRFGGSDALVGLGPCLAPLGGLCLDLGRSAIELGSAVADGLGVATLALQVPTLQPNGVYRVQAVVLRGVGGVDSMKSNRVVFDGADLDWDADGLSDATELWLGTDPTLPDTDGDGLDDPEELPRFDPVVADSDGDGALDGADVCWGGDDAQDGDGDGTADACDRCPFDPNPAQADADQDGLGDGCDGRVLLSSGWTAEGDQSEALLGASTALAGDVNGDGYDDVVVGAYLYDHGQINEGVATMYLGSAAGLSAAPAWAAEGDQAQAFFGISVASAGDVDGDGFADVLVGAPGRSGAVVDGGAVALYLGSAAGLSARPDWTAEGGQSGADFGVSVASAGDVNGDGYDDVLIGAYQEDDDRPDEGVARLYLGSAAGLSAAPAWTADGDREDARFGLSVASAGDVNGDGYDDVVVGALGGLATLYLGSPAGLSLWPTWVALGLEGAVAASAGDVNGDGYDDVLVGVSEYHAYDEGIALLYLGSPTGPSDVPIWSVEGDQYEAELSRVAPAGDVNGDGYADVLVGAPSYDSLLRDWGIARLYLGSPTGLAEAPAWRGVPNQGHTYYGDSVSSAGDVDGDGLSDVLVGARFFDNGQTDEGGAFLYLGNTP